MKIVLDTNSLLVSISERSPFYPIYRALKNKEFELAVTTDILLEYEEIIAQEMGEAVSEDVLSFLELSNNVHKISTKFYWHLIIADPDDDKFADAAIAANADFMVSDDKHFRILKNVPFPKVWVITTTEFLDMVIKGAPFK